ncbi:phosphatase PAP2 family protein [Pseudoxanthomonas sp.]|uniref:phosphatase PAP2 family protein n=1 Tax=Pseudoxanthomonas sp. TaxID=1871049 RepID=UPI002FE20BB8
MSSAPFRLLSRPLGQPSRLLPWSLPVLLLAWFATHHLDMSVARWLFHWEGDAWSLKRSLLLEHGLHRGGRLLSQAAWASVFVATLLHWRSPESRAWTRPAARLLLSVFASVACVAALKAVTQMDCPWDLAGLGGDRAFIGLFETRPASLGPAACFPAAHAAGGYAWVALYFFFLHTAPRWRHAGLAIGLLAGAVFGLTQQLRGAHFLSHDVASLAVCWTIACAIEAVGARRAAEVHA